MKVFFHNNCFDGLASAAVFSNFYSNAINKECEFIYEGLAHHAGQLFLDVEFDGDENAIVDSGGQDGVTRFNQEPLPGFLL